MLEVFHQAVPGRLEGRNRLAHHPGLSDVEDEATRVVNANVSYVGDATHGHEAVGLGGRQLTPVLLLLAEPAGYGHGAAKAVREVRYVEPQALTVHGHGEAVAVHVRVGAPKRSPLRVSEDEAPQHLIHRG